MNIITMAISGAALIVSTIALYLQLYKKRSYTKSAKVIILNVAKDTIFFLRLISDKTKETKSNNRNILDEEYYDKQVNQLEEYYKMTLEINLFELKRKEIVNYQAFRSFLKMLILSLVKERERYLKNANSDKDSRLYLSFQKTMKKYENLTIEFVKDTFDKKFEAIDL